MGPGHGQVARGGQVSPEGAQPDLQQIKHVGTEEVGPTESALIAITWDARFAGAG